MGISIWQLLIVLLIVILLFGTRRLKTLGSDLGSAIKSFRSAVKEGEEQAADNERVLEGEAKRDKERERT